MKTMKYYLWFLMLTAFVFSQNGYARDQNAPVKDLPNFARVNANFYRGAQPTEAGINELARMGVKTIINLRGEDKNALREKEWARKAGIKFIAVDLSNWLKPKTADIEQIIKEIEQPENQPVFVHCQRGADRTGTVVAVYRISRDNYTAKQANDEAKQFGFGWWQFWMKDYINDYYRDFKSEK